MSAVYTPPHDLCKAICSQPQVLFTQTLMERERKLDKGHMLSSDPKVSGSKQGFTLTKISLRELATV